MAVVLSEVEKRLAWRTRQWPLCDFDLGTFGPTTSIDASSLNAERQLT
jgi:hypothetical protein